MATLAELELAYLTLLGHTEGTLADRWAAEYGGQGAFAYWAGESGLTPAQNYSVTDHEFQVYKNETLVTDRSFTDTKILFLRAETGL